MKEADAYEKSRKDVGHMVWQRGAGSGVARESEREGLEPGGRVR